MSALDLRDALMDDIQAARRSGDDGQIAHAVYMAETHGVDRPTIDRLFEEEP